MTLRSRLVAVVALTICFSVSTYAAPATFTIQSAQSSLTLSGNVGGNAISQQTANSLFTRFTGSINTELTASTIQFTSASANAQLQGSNQQPDDDGFGSPGNGPADYGFQFSTQFGTGFGALRDLLFNVTSGSIPLSGSTYASSVNVGFSDGTLDHRAASGAQNDLFGLSAGNNPTPGSIQTSGNTQTLTLPIQVSYTTSILTSGDTQLTLTGSLVATRLIPEPSMVTALIPIAAAALARRKRD